MESVAIHGGLEPVRPGHRRGVRLTVACVLKIEKLVAALAATRPAADQGCLGGSSNLSVMQSGLQVLASLPTVCNVCDAAGELVCSVSFPLVNDV